MKVGVIGMGVVGLSLAVVLAQKNTCVFGIENQKSKLLTLKAGKAPFHEPDLEPMLSNSLKNGKLKFFRSINEVYDKIDIIFVTVGTATIDGRTNLNAIKKMTTSIAKLLKNCKRTKLIIIKSTTPPETTEKIIIPILEKYSKKKLGQDLFLVTNPEFLREGLSIFDQLNPHMILIGTHDQKSKEIISNFYNKIYPENVPRFFVNFSTSEMIKYANNAFAATKISFINTISNLCQKIPNANVDEISKCIGMDPRSISAYLKAGPGYGGSCLPKDLDSLILIYKKHKMNPVFFSSVKKVNTHQINEIITIMKQKLRKLDGKVISILGLSFKENSDDIRGSVSIQLIRKLLKKNCKIKVHDPVAIPNTKKVFYNDISYFENEDKCLECSDCVIIMTPWDRYKNLDLEIVRKMNHPFIIDTRRILSNPNVHTDYVALGKTIFMD